MLNRGRSIELGDPRSELSKSGHSKGLICRPALDRIHPLRHPRVISSSNEHEDHVIGPAPI